MKKLFFPFYNSVRHGFLLKKPWFRAMMVIFIAVTIVSIPIIWYYIYYSAYTSCIGIDIKNYTVIGFGQSCSEYANLVGTYPPTILKAVVMPIISFYFIQLIFFKLIVNFIYLGSKK